VGETNEDADAFREAVEEALVDELYSRARQSFVGLALVLGILRLLLDDVFAKSRALPVVFYAIVGAFAVRLVILFFARKKQGYFASVRRRHVVFAMGSTTIALGFCAMNLVAFPHLDAVQVATLAVCHTGINAIALVSMGGSPVTYHLYMLPMLGPLVVLSAIGPHGSGLRLLPVMIMLYITVLSVMALHEYRSRRDNILLRLRIAEMALVDALTQLRNRRYLHEFMDSEVEQVLRDWSGAGGARKKLWLMMVDLDHFKNVNDRYGHDAGDAVLRQLAVVLRDTVRKQDVLARWGGEEFVVVARDVEESAGSVLAERLRERVAAHDFVLPGSESIKLTCSIGFSAFPFVAESPRALRWDDVLGLADAGLYRAKQQGRNRVVGILSGETAHARGRAAVDEVKLDVERASVSGIVRLVS
jgi:diguanylate cyclase (GGDEF)-like protein